MRTWPGLPRPRLFCVRLTTREAFQVEVHDEAVTGRDKLWLVFHRAWPDLQRMKLLLPGGAVLPGQFPPSLPPGLARPAARGPAGSRKIDRLHLTPAGVTHPGPWWQWTSRSVARLSGRV